MAIRSYLKDGKRLYEAYVNGFTARGTRIQRKRSGLDTRRKAETIEFELKRELAKLKEEKVDLRWGEWLEECLGILKVNSQPSTYYTYEKAVSKWVNQHWNDRELKSITRMDIHQMLYEVLPSSVTMNTRKYVLKIIKRILQMALDHGRLDRNPCQGLTIKVPEPEKKVLSNQEVETFLREARLTNHRFYPVWVVALFTGMRSGELYALRWTDVDFETGVIQVSRSWSSKNGFTSTKNQKTRTVPISSELMHYLKELKLQRGGHGQAQENGEYVLPRLLEWSRGDAADVTRTFCKSLGLTGIRFHDLRATLVTNLLSRGESLARVMAIVGHSDMETTNVYLRKAGIELKDATERLGYKVPTAQSGVVLNLPRRR